MRGSENTIGVAIMSRQNRINPSDPGAQADRPSTKKPYQKPAFRHERVFETRALVCGRSMGPRGMRLQPQDFLTVNSVGAVYDRPGFFLQSSCRLSAILR